VVFIVGFVMLFIFSGIGNGSTYKMIPAIFHAKAQLEVGAGFDLAEADQRNAAMAPTSRSLPVTCFAVW
jgi:MFS transporter, NNP family, nitrate/nitrite transporter